MYLQDPNTPPGVYLRFEISFLLSKLVSISSSFITSIEKIAKASNIKTVNITGRMKIKALLIIYFATFLTWAKDENPSLDKTMTALDNYLQRAENIIKFFK